MAKSPMKFGLGEYSDKPFALKSGNKPAFKMMGSPADLKGVAHPWTEYPKHDSPANHQMGEEHEHEDGPSAPINLKSFGIGKGTSPYRQDEDENEGGNGYTNVESHAGDPYEYRKKADGGYEYKDTRGGDWTVAKGKGLESIKKNVKF